ncbi:hypothetical protein BJ138DRAFT_37240 [Hygrophoropsis aurantiaca]|uniref:Uncharacterized protein n=1 Tax=Hygrophoropsis aurantiaca TaxID=72124 RepID=A0ACB8ACT9_9AGAM|nr:hypothetical protein BJ138DRAFT_37240 [Hygrophoropsis aurantiaca]
MANAPHPQNDGNSRDENPVVAELPPKYPPFPAAPKGTTIIPFKDFIPSGYKRVQSSAEDGTITEIEVDAGFGIPTVKVLNEGEALQRSKDRKRRRNAGQSKDDNGKIIQWWDEWEQSENTRTASFDVTAARTMSYAFRVQQATDDFRLGRTWPPIAYGVRTLWDHFRIYIGLITKLPIYRKPKGGNKGNVDIPYDVPGEGSSEENTNAPRANHTSAPMVIQDPLEQMAHPGQHLVHEGERIDLLESFVTDMEKSIRVFLSSYMRDKGLIWSQRNLFIAPTILHFFLHFMLRNNIFLDSPEHTASLQRALAIAELAKTELPLTANIGQLLPDTFGTACKECWGIQGSLSVQIPVTVPNHDSLDARNDSEGDAGTSENTPVNADDASKVFEEELKAEGNAEIIPSDVVLDSITAKQVLADNVDEDTPISTHAAHAITEDTSTSAASWNHPGDPWMAALSPEEHTTSSWTDVAVHTLINLMGPTALPLTHLPGISEYSTRRVKQIIPPRAIDNMPSSPGRVIPSFSMSQTHMIEEDLQDHFACVILEPWIRSVDEAGVDIVEPVLTSTGPVVEPSLVEGHPTLTQTNGHAQITDAHRVVDAGGRCIFDAYTHDVTLLVDPVLVEYLSPGMGLCGTWVQIARMYGQGQCDKDEGQGASEALEHGYWYMEALISIYPSFYTEGKKIGEEDDQEGED